MRTLKFLLQKEFRQIIRNKAILPLLFAVPIVQLLILPLAADYEVKNVNISIVDHDNSSYSQILASKITASDYFRLISYTNNYKKTFQHIENEETDLILEIPHGFEKNIIRNNKENLFISINAINGVKASLGGNYLNSIIASFNEDIRLEWQPQPTFNSRQQIEIISSNWFNPHMNYRVYMVPGILALLITMIGAYMCALNIVKEKEVGTIEQINVTPVKKHQFILGKLIPFWTIGMVVFTIGLFIIGGLIYNIVPVGNLILLYVYLSIYLTAVLGIGLLISTYSETQQQAMSVAFFFMMIFILMSGLFTSIDSMPTWANTITKLSPVTYFIEVLRMIVLKGSGFADIKNHFMVIIGFAIVLNTWAILNYKKTN